MDEAAVPIGKSVPDTAPTTKPRRFERHDRRFVLVVLALLTGIWLWTGSHRSTTTARGHSPSAFAIGGSRQSATSGANNSDNSNSSSDSGDDGGDSGGRRRRRRWWRLTRAVRRPPSALRGNRPEGSGEKLVTTGPATG